MSHHGNVFVMKAKFSYVFFYWQKWASILLELVISRTNKYASIQRMCRDFLHKYKHQVWVRYDNMIDPMIVVIPVPLK